MQVVSICLPLLAFMQGCSALRGIKAKQHREFRYLEPALVPIGSYIALETLPLKTSNTIVHTAANKTIDLPALINSLIDAEIASERAFYHEKKMAPHRSESTQRFLAGIRPLKAIRLPMGIFVPDQPEGAVQAPAEIPTVTTQASTDSEDPSDEEEITIMKSLANHRKITRGMRKVFDKIRNSVQERQQRQDEPLSAEPFNYPKTFSGLKVKEAVYVPRGVYVPLSNIPDQSKGENQNPYYSGLLPLSILNLPPGVFIPQNLNEFPDVPGSILPSNGKVMFRQKPRLNRRTLTERPCDPNEEFQTTCQNGTNGEGSATKQPDSEHSTLLPLTMPGEAGSTLKPIILDDPDKENRTAAVEKAFKQWIHEQYTKVGEDLLTKNAEAIWKFETNITEENEKEMIASQRTVDLFHTKVAEAIRAFHFKDLKDPELTRLYLKMSDSGDTILPTEKWTELNKVKSSMLTTYSSAKICADTSIPVDQMDKCPDEKKWAFNPQITRSMATSRSSELLLHIWKSWREATGKVIKPDFLRYVLLKNESAVIDGYPELGLKWRVPYVEPAYNYSDKSFMREVQDILRQVTPLYQQLHGYVRQRLAKKYPEAKIKPTGPIPAHLLGNMWGNSWRNIFDLVLPYPKKSVPDITVEMRKLNWTVLDMYKAADKFVTDLGLLPMNENYWNKSMFARPTDDEQDVVCHGMSVDFQSGQDFRTKTCASVTREDFINAHQEVARVEYFMQYKNHYIPFRNGANPGFLEAVGDLFTLSVATPTHLRKLKLLATRPTFGNEFASDINFLLAQALDKVVALPFNYIVDHYRYDVFSSRITTDKLNKQWWRLVTKYQGICSPTEQTEDYLDPASKYEIAADIPYIQEFVGTVLQFQFHKALCEAAAHSGPLYTCDIDGSKEAGRKLQDMMSLGSSGPWQDAMKIITGDTKLDAGPMLEYFELLADWLERENSQSDAHIGWDLDETCIPGA